MLEAIPAGAAALMVVAGILGLTTKRGQAILSATPIVGKVLGVFVLAVLLLIVGVQAGGGAYLSDAWGKTTASFGSSSSSSTGQATLDDISSCVYSAGTATSGGVTLRTDPNSQNRVFIDIVNATWQGANVTANEANLTFNCDRIGSVKDAGSVDLAVNGFYFGSETAVSSANTYNILEQTNTPSTVWSGKKQQTAYVATNGYATSSSKKEHEFLKFAEGEKSATLGVRLEISQEAINNMVDNSQKEVTIFKRVNGVDTAVAYVTVVRDA